MYSILLQLFLRILKNLFANICINSIAKSLIITNKYFLINKKS